MEDNFMNDNISKNVNYFMSLDKDNQIRCLTGMFETIDSLTNETLFMQTLNDDAKLEWFNNESFELANDLSIKIDKAIEYIRNNCILSNEWTDLDFCNFIPTGNIKYKQLTSKKVRYLLNILRGKDKPEYLGYSDKECINCGRQRVEKYSDGTEICEKCNFDQNKKEYVLRGKEDE